MNLTLLYQDAHIVVCIKPPGVPSQPDPSGAADMPTLLSEQLKLDPTHSPGIVHRLDRPVGGVMIYAKSKQALAQLNRQLQSDGFNKGYLAVCCGTPALQEAHLSHWLLRDGRTNTSRIVQPKTPNAKEARLTYRVLQVIQTEAWGPLALLAVQLDTGRHHQIRVQLAGAGLPIWGDTKYNPMFQKRRGWFAIGLFSDTLAFRHPLTNEPLSFSARPAQEPFCFFIADLKTDDFRPIATDGHR